MSKQGFTTALLHCDRQQPIEHGSIHQPVHNGVAYGYQSAEQLSAVFQGRENGYSYGRQNNPTTTALEQKITLMEQGLKTVCFATGMAAITATLLSLLRAGDHMVSSRFLFGNTNSLFNTLTEFGVEVSFVDATDVDAVADQVNSKTKLVFVETIANPCTQIADMAAIGELCIQQNLLFIVDNTMTSPLLFQPAKVKAGLVINSLTKCIAGHGNVLGGSVTETGVFDWSKYDNIYPNYKKNNPQSWGLLQIRKKGLRDTGATLAPDSANKIAMGAETLALRIPRACANAAALAKFFNEHPKVKKVHYPGLASHPQHQRAKDLFSDFGPMLSIDLVDGVDCFAVLNRLKVAILSSHLGDNRTLVIPVAHTIFHEMGAQRRQSMGISENTVRISFGIEDQQDLQVDFADALAD